MSAYSDLVIEDGPIAYWRLDEPSGTTANDEIGSLDGTISGSPTMNATGAVQAGSKAITFDGVNDYINLGTPAALRPAELSIECWIKTTTTSTGTIVRSRNRGYKLSVASGAIRGGFTNTSGTFREVVSRGFYNDGQWHHVVLTYDLTDVLLYVDGIVVASVTLGSPEAIDYSGGGGTTGVAIGREGDSSSSYFVGSIDEVAIYDYALSIEQINVHGAYASPRSGWMFTFPPPLAREGSGVCVCDGDLYVVGGVTAASQSRQVYAYDTDTRTWIQKADLPSAASYGCAMEHDGKIYFLRSNTSRFVSYDPEENAWTELYDALYTGNRITACIHSDGFLYAWDTVGSTHRAQRYSFDTLFWTDVTPPSSTISCAFFNAISYGDLIYLCGIDEFTNDYPYDQRLYSFDPVLQVYTELAQPPDDGSPNGRDPAFVEKNGIFWLMGGLHSYDGYTNDVLLYDPDANTWSTGTDMNGAVKFTRAAVFNGQIFVVRGNPFSTDTESQVWRDPPIAGQATVNFEFALFNYAYNAARLEWEFALNVGLADIEYAGIAQPGLIRTTPRTAIAAPVPVGLAEDDLNSGSTVDAFRVALASVREDEDTVTMLVLTTDNVANAPVKKRILTYNKTTHHITGYGAESTLFTPPSGTYAGTLDAVGMGRSEILSETQDSRVLVTYILSNGSIWARLVTIDGLDAVTVESSPTNLYDGYAGSYFGSSLTAIPDGNAGYSAVDMPRLIAMDSFYAIAVFNDLGSDDATPRFLDPDGVPGRIAFRVISVYGDFIDTNRARDLMPATFGPAGQGSNAGTSVGIVALSYRRFLAVWSEVTGATPVYRWKAQVLDLDDTVFPERPVAIGDEVQIIPSLTANATQLQEARVCRLSANRVLAMYCDLDHGSVEKGTLIEIDPEGDVAALQLGELTSSSDATPAHPSTSTYTAVAQAYNRVMLTWQNLDDFAGTSGHHGVDVRQATIHTDEHLALGTDSTLPWSDNWDVLDAEMLLVEPTHAVVVMASKQRSGSTRSLRIFQILA